MLDLYCCVSPKPVTLANHLLVLIEILVVSALKSSSVIETQHSLLTNNLMTLQENKKTFSRNKSPVNPGLRTGEI